MKLARWAVLIVLMWAGLELVTGAGLFVLDRLAGVRTKSLAVRSIPDRHRRDLGRLLADDLGYLTYSAALGWTIKPGGRGDTYRANAQGIRADREFARVPPPGTLRIAAFGDSFTHGDEVPNEDTWQEILMRAHPAVEAMNFGVGAYGLDQAFLRYQRDGADYGARVVLMGFMPENLFRHVNVYRPFYVPNSGLALAKPRYKLAEGRLVLVDNPMRDLSGYRELLANPERELARLGAHDLFFQVRPHEGALDLPLMRVVKSFRWSWTDWRLGVNGGSYDASGEPFRVTAAIVEAFAATVSRNGSLPIFVVYPRRRDVERFQRNGSRLYAALIDHCRARGIRVIDLVESLGSGGAPLDTLVLRHYTAAGNRVVAEAIWRYLEREKLLAATSAP
jgi:hypothetical protein